MGYLFAVRADKVPTARTAVANQTFACADAGGGLDGGAFYERALIKEIAEELAGTI